MDTALGLLIPFAIIVAIVLMGVVDWYRKKELRDMRTLDLRILAMDMGGEFIEDDKSVHSILDKNSVAYVSNGNIRNVIQKQGLGYHAAVFDYSYLTGGKNKKTVNLTGIALRFDQGGLPQFKIAKKVFLDWLTLSGYPRVRSSDIPNWLKNRISIFAPAKLQDHVCNLVSDNSKIQDIVTDSNFRGLFCNDSRVVLYFYDQYEATEHGYIQTERFVDELVSIFGENAPDAADWHSDIKLLKQTAQG